MAECSDRSVREAQLTFQDALTCTLTALGVRELKPKQEEALKSIMLGRDVFVILPTGYGKSLIYAVLPTLHDFMFGCEGSIVIVITPLIALMVDQKQNLIQMGISVEFVGEAQCSEEAVQSVVKGEIQLVFISPESILNNKKYRNMLQKNKYQDNLVALVVDEAHCVQMWGECFRKAFYEIGSLRSLLPKSVCLMALTATATKQTVSTVLLRLAMQNPEMIGLNVERSNIKYIVKESATVDDFTDVFTEQLMSSRTNTPKTVIFCQTLQACAEMYASLKTKLGPNITEPPGLPNIPELRLVTLFTAASTNEMREIILKQFCKINSVLRVVVASSAFGMGVNIPNISCIINWGLPLTLEDLVQQTGRAGRNGQPAKAILYARSNNSKASKLVKEYAENNKLCRRYLLFKDFLYTSEKQNISACRCCDLCTPLCTCMYCKNK